MAAHDTRETKVVCSHDKRWVGVGVRGLEGGGEEECFKVATVKYFGYWLKMSPFPHALLFSVKESAMQISAGSGGHICGSAREE